MAIDPSESIEAKYARTIEIRAQIEELSEELADLEAELGATQPAKFLDIPGVGRFERYRTSAKTTWDSDRLRAQCIRTAREQRIADHNGEIIEDPVEAAVHVLSTAARFEWRAGDKKNPDNPDRPGLATWGIDADEYREREQGILKVKFIGAPEGGAS